MKISKYLLLGISVIIFTNCEKKLPSTLTVVNINLIDENDKPVEGYTFQINGFYPKGLSAIGTFNEFLKTDSKGNITFEKLVISPTKNITISPISDSFKEQILIKTKAGNYEKTGLFLISIGFVNQINYKLIKK